MILNIFILTLAKEIIAELGPDPFGLVPKGDLGRAKCQPAKRLWCLQDGPPKDG